MAERFGAKIPNRLKQKRLRDSRERDSRRSRMVEEVVEEEEDEPDVQTWDR